MAGLTAAYWFARLGHRVTVVERSAGLRPGGAPIDVRGRALGTAERMGILGKIAEQRVALLEPAPVFDGAGMQVATIDLRWFANETDDDIEITRDRLNRILLDVIPDGVEFRFGTSITSLVDRADGVDLALTDGREERADLVVGADGLHSNVRRLAFGPERDFVRHLGYYVALVDLPADMPWQRGKLNIPGMSVSVRDAGDGPQGSMLVASPELNYDYRDVSDQRRLISDFLSRLDSWQVPAIRAAFLDPDAKGFYFDSVSQTHMPSWLRGNVAVIGDAGHCAALLSGFGTTLAMVAAEILATAWTEHGGVTDRMTQDYHRELRPYVEQCQAFALRGAPLMVPLTQEALDQRNASFRAYATKFA
jgi:2-polyprenyl-6-methoxyphenol hydroxylase-like FAD-dependent oxidoreductase